jgi:hypothetical protein
VDGCHVAAPTADDLAEKLDVVLSAGGRVDARATLTDISLERIGERLLNIYQSIIERTGDKATRRE